VVIETKCATSFVKICDIIMLLSSQKKFPGFDLGARLLLKLDTRPCHSFFFFFFTVSLLSLFTWSMKDGSHLFPDVFP
jgi:hypothetical protein